MEGLFLAPESTRHPWGDVVRRADNHKGKTAVVPVKVESGEILANPLVGELIKVLD